MNDETNNLFLRYSLSLSLILIYILYSPFTLWTDMYSLYLSDFCTSFCRELSLSLLRSSFSDFSISLCCFFFLSKNTSQLIAPSGFRLPSFEHSGFCIFRGCL